MKDEIEISNMIRKMTGMIDREEVRKEVGNELERLSLIADPNEFNELLSRFIKFSDGAEVLRNKWKIVYNNSEMPLELIGILAQDDNIRTNILSDVDYLINYGNFCDTSRLAEELVKIEGGIQAISNNIEILIRFSKENVDKIVIPALKEEIGKEKVKNNFNNIKQIYLRKNNIKGFFKFIKELKEIEIFKDIYEDYGYWAELFDQIETPNMKGMSIAECLKLSKNHTGIIGDCMAEQIKEDSFLKIINSDYREEKKLILQEVANGNSYKYKAAGTTSFVIQAGDQVVKLGELSDKFEIPYHPRIMMPYFRKKYEDYSALEVYNFGNVGSAEITDEKLLEIYKELEDAGIKWGDARKENLLVLTKDNDLPDFIKSKDFNIFGFLDDERFPTNNHRVLKKGDIVICDLYMLYAKEDPAYEEGCIDDVIKKYLSSKNKVKNYEDDSFSH